MARTPVRQDAINLAVVFGVLALGFLVLIGVLTSFWIAFIALVACVTTAFAMILWEVADDFPDKN